MLDVLEGRHLSRAESVARHLNRLLNARAGVLPHMEDYGLPDVAHLFMGMPHSVDVWSRAVHDAILRFEPRVRRVNIEMDGFDANEQTLRLRVEASLVDGASLNLSAVFDSSGGVRVSRAAA